MFGLETWGSIVDEKQEKEEAFPSNNKPVCATPANICVADECKGDQRATEGDDSRNIEASYCPESIFVGYNLLYASLNILH